MRDRDFRDRSWEIWHCASCGYGWTLPPISREALADYYPADYLGNLEKTLQDLLTGRFQRTRSWRRETEKRRLVERVLRGGRLLDVGCSNAAFLLSLDASRWQAVGVELIPEAVELLQLYFPQLEVYQGQLQEVPLGEESCDVVTFWHVFEHLEDPKQILACTYRLLRPGGWVFISLPNLRSVQAKVFGRHWYAFDVPRHLHHFTPASLERLLGESGFQVKRHVFFSKLCNFHHLKHSLIRLSEEYTGSRAIYYLLKPLLFPMQWLEAASGYYGSLTTLAQKES